MSDSFFDTLQRAPVSTSAGPVDLPILYRDATLLTLIYRVDPMRAKACIPHESLEPWVALGKALAFLCIFEYRDTTIGPYGEIGVGVLTRRAGTTPSLLAALYDLRKDPNAALYVVNLPVSTEGARAAGVELWGYPKYVSRMETEFGPAGARVTLGKEFVLTMGKGRGPWTPGIPFVTYSVNAQDHLVRTVIEVDNKVQWGGTGSVKLELGEHGPTSESLRTLGVAGQKPAFAFRTDKMRSILPQGVDLGSVLGAPS